MPAAFRVMHSVGIVSRQPPTQYYTSLPRQRASSAPAAARQLCLFWTATGRAGKHVLIEIPMGMSLAESERLAALEQETELTCMVCHSQR